MSDINMQLAREFFELNLFYVLPHWRYEADQRDSDYIGAMLFVEQHTPAPPMELDCLLRPGDVKGIQRAVVEVRAWHADRLYPSIIESNPVFARVASQQTRTLAESIFGGQAYKIILVVSEFSSAPAKRDQAVRTLQKQGVDHVIEFPTLLAEIVRLVSAQGGYAASHSLQTIRLLKRYGFIRRQQLELFFPAPAPDAPVLPSEVESNEIPESDTGESEEEPDGLF